MAYFDLSFDVFPIKALSPVAISSNTTTNGATIDLFGYGACQFALQATVTDGTYTPVIQDSDDGSTWADVADTYLSKTEASAALSTSTTESNISYVGKKRYARCNTVSAGTTSGAVVSITANRGKKIYAS